MRHAVLVRGGPGTPVSQDPLDVLEHGRTGAAWQAGEPFTTHRTGGGFWPAQAPAGAVLVRLPRRLSRRRRATADERAVARGKRGLPTYSEVNASGRSTLRRNLLTDAEVLAWVRGQGPGHPWTHPKFFASARAVNEAWDTRDPIEHTPRRTGTGLGSPKRLPRRAVVNETVALVQPPTRPPRVIQRLQVRMDVRRGILVYIDDDEPVQMEGSIEQHENPDRYYRGALRYTEHLHVHRNVTPSSTLRLRPVSRDLARDFETTAYESHSRSLDGTASPFIEGELHVTSLRRTGHFAISNCTTRFDEAGWWYSEVELIFTPHRIAAQSFSL